MAALGRAWKLLVITEDWCGDAANSVPVIARMAEGLPGVALRLLARDENPALMDQYLTDGARSIPIAIALDDGFQSRGHWGPRPEELQRFVLEEKRAGIRPAAEIYRDVRRWYAKDNGESIVRKILEMLHTAAR